MKTFEKWAKKLFPYNIAFLLVYIGLPLLLLASISDEETAAMMVVSCFLRVNTSVTLFLGLFFGIRNGMKWYFLIPPVFWSFLACMLFFGKWELLYLVLIYAVCAAGGCYVGSLFKRHYDEMYL